MRIAFLTDGIYPYVIGGMQKHSFYLVKYFCQQNIDIDLIHFSQSEDHDIQSLDVFSEEEKKRINSIVIDFPKGNTLPGHYIRESYKHSELVYNGIKSRLDSYDFIYVKGLVGWKLLEEKKKGVKMPPVGIKFHGYEMFQRSVNVRNKLEHYMLRKPIKFNTLAADYVFSYGGKITNIIKSLGVPSEKIIEIPSGIDSEWLDKQEKITHSPLRFVFVGRYEVRKGIKELTQAINNLKKSKDFIFEFIGPIPDELKIESEKVVYHGSLSDQDTIKKILSKCDVLVCPSYSEGMPNVIIEGMARGLCVIATDVGAVNLLVSSKTGWLLDECSPKSISEAMVKAIGTPSESLTGLKSNSRELVESRFVWNEVIKDYMTFLESISKVSC